MEGLKKVIKAYNKVEEVFLVITIVVSVMLLFINVILRYCFNSSVYGADEIAKICFIWMSWLGISIGQRENEHVRIDMVQNLLKGNTKKGMLILADVVTIAILMSLVVLGIAVTEQFFFNNAVTPMWRFPKWVLFLSVPFSSGIMLLRLVGHIVEVAKSRDERAGTAAEEV